MIIEPTAHSLLTRGASAVSSPVKVCMHALRKSQTDVRAMRAATALREAGFAVSIVDVEGESSQSVEEDSGGIHLKHMIVPNSFITTRFKQRVLIRAPGLFIRGALQLLRTPADIYHALDLPALPACYIVAKLRRKPLIFEAYELPLSTLSVSELSISRRWLHGLLAPLLVYMLPRCTGVITVSPPLVEELRKRYHCSAVSLIRNVPVYRAVSKNNRLREYIGLGPEVRIVLYQGFLQTSRSLDLLIRAAAFLEQNIFIVMMGAGDEATQSQLKALIAREGVTDRVRILPPVPYDELLDWTASADLGSIIYMPDRVLNNRMMLPNKLFEYLMAGLPILSSQIEAISNVISTYEVGQVVTSLAPEDIAKAINTLMADHTSLARMRRNALYAAQQVFCWEKEKEKLIALYQKCLPGNTPTEVFR